MTVSYTSTIVFQNNTAIARNEYIAEHTTLELLSPLYPTANLSQDDVNAIISDLQNELDLDWQRNQNPGLLDITYAPYHDELGSGVEVTRSFTDMTACNNMRAKYMLFDYRLYTLDGVNLLYVSDGTVASVLNPKEYARWQWNFYSQVITTPGTPHENP